jgi:hypothetical protein
MILIPGFVDHQSPAEVAARYGVHRTLVYKLRPAIKQTARPRWSPAPRRPKTSPAGLSAEVVDLIVRVRKE